MIAGLVAALLAVSAISVATPSHVHRHAAVQKDPAVVSPFCPVASGPPGDAYPGSQALPAGENEPALDITMVGLDTESGSLAARIAVQSLKDLVGHQPMVYGRGDYWQVDFANADDGVEYSVWAELPIENAVSQAVNTGWIDGSGSHPGGSGSLDIDAGTITVLMPLNAVNLHTHDFAVGTRAWSASDLGGGQLLDADMGVRNLYDYLVGMHC